MLRVKSTLMRCLFLFSFILISLNASETFPVYLTGPSASIDYLKAKSEYTLGKSTKFCRGFYIPASVSDWSCKAVGNQETKCSINYKCKLIRKNFSRVTESRRLYENLKKFPSRQVSYKLSVGKKSYQREKIKSTSALSLSSLTPRQKEIMERKNSQEALRSGLKSIKNEVRKFDEFEALEREVDRNKVARKAMDNKKEKLTVETLDDLEKEELDSFSEEPIAKQTQTKKVEKKQQSDPFGDDWMKEPVKEEKSGEKNSKEEKIEEKSEEEIDDLKTLKFKKFELSYVKISDEFDNSVASIDVAWTPRYRMSQRFGFKGFLGTHSYQIDTIVETETIRLIDFGASLELFFGKSFFGEFGLGMQKWGGSVGQTFSSLQFGLGYQFSEVKLYAIDRLFFRSRTVGSDNSNTEAYFGAGLTF